MHYYDIYLKGVIDLYTSAHIVVLSTILTVV